MIFLKKFFHLHKKVPGISLMISFLTSMLVLALALVTLASIVRSFERTVGIERGNKVFFAAESGIEAAFFHKNSRQSSVHFDWEAWSDGAAGTCGENEESGTCPTELKTVEIQQTGTGAKTRWKLLSRFVPEDLDSSGSTEPSERIYTGVLKEFQNIEIPLYYDEAENPSLGASQVDMLDSAGSYEFFVRIDPDDEFDAPVENGNLFNFGDNRTYNQSVTTPTVDVLAAGGRREQIVIDWSLSRQNNTSNRIQTFSPIRDLGVPCQIDDANESAIWCEQDLTESIQEIVFSEPLISGNVRPCNSSDAGAPNCNPSLANFAQGADGTGLNVENYKLRMQQLAPLEHHHSNGTEAFAKKDGIDFEVQIPQDTELPLPSYTIVSEVEQGDYQKEITLTVNEATSIGAFSYVIFE